jgi:hypothetical protein
MNKDIYFDLDLRLITVSFNGALSSSFLVEVFEEVKTSPSFDSNWPLLIDFSAAEVDFPVEELGAIAQVCQRIYEDQTKAPIIAMVADNPLAVAYCSIFLGMVNGQLNIFTLKSNALNWLSQFSIPL